MNKNKNTYFSSSKKIITIEIRGLKTKLPLLFCMNVYLHPFFPSSLNNSNWPMIIMRLFIQNWRGKFGLNDPLCFYTSILLNKTTFSFVLIKVSVAARKHNTKRIKLGLFCTLATNSGVKNRTSFEFLFFFVNQKH